LWRRIVSCAPVFNRRRPGYQPAATISFTASILRLLLVPAVLPLVIGAQQALLEPVQPVLAWIYPAGGQRGTTVEVTASGTAIAPQSVLITGGGVTARVVDAKDPAKVRIAGRARAADLECRRGFQPRPFRGGPASGNQRSGA
jgi:hypothetical protein